MRKFLLAVFGLMGSCGMLVLLAIQVKSEVFQKTELQFQAPQPYVVQTSKPIPGRPDSSSISLPYAVNGTALIVERLVSYDGAFLENNSGCEVKNVAALLMTNSGDMGISQVRVAKKVLEEYNIDMPIFGMVKDGKHRTRTIVDDNGKEYTIKLKYQ